VFEIIQVTAVLVQLADAVNVTLSLYRIKTMYPVIGEPPSAGAAQVIVTSLPKITMIGAAGLLGTIGNTAPLPSVE
jgi:hypothetical protein